ncbi:MAG: histidine kinase [Winogradskyella sp.]|uniref:tetratricopeptide repeat-containing sensor histidine kinase n=1 Tax=Winogradskyella sp. TaxID=1883156 RepID=UPI000F3F1235|nr:tetratricopeptide repeat-containing sensor histidine kinase [Winogradskyella sp.]RNC84099.1 MAG: histidine kinase [Winogradskyella sp.]
MSAKFIFPLLLVCFSFVSTSQNSPCTKEEVINAFVKSDKFKQAYNYLSKNSLDESYKLIKELKQESQKTLDKDLEVFTLFIEGELHRKNKAFRKSIETFQLLLSKEPPRNLTFYTYLAMGNIYMSGLRDFGKVNLNYKNAEELLDGSSCEEKKALLYSALGNSYLLNENYKEAEAYYKKGLKIYVNTSNFNEAATNYSNLGNLYFEKYEDRKAREYFLKALNTFQKKDSTNINARQRVNYNLSAVYEALKDYEKSLKYLNQANVLRDSIWNSDRVWEIAELEKKIEVEKREKRVSILEAENKVKSAQRNGVIISALILLALLGVSVYYYREKVKTNKIISDQNEELDQLNATKDKLFSIVSHDLRSSVNALKTSNKGLINSLKTKNIEELDVQLNSNSAIVNGAYNLLDNLLNWALLQTKQSYFNIEPHRLFHLVEHVAYNYQALIFEKNLDFKNDVSKKEKIQVDQESFKIVLRNLMDNAIKFTKENGKISIYSQSENDEYINLIIEDNGLGMSEQTRLELLKETTLLSKKENEDIIGTGLGMQLCKSMIKKNKGIFNIESELGKGTKIIVSFPKVIADG